MDTLPGRGSGRRAGGRGRDRGRGRGRGRPPQQHQRWEPAACGRGRGIEPRPSHGCVTEPPSPAVVEVLAMEQESGSSSSGESLKAVCRPDGGGTRGTEVRLIANHFKVLFDPSLNVFHYDLDMRLGSDGDTSKKCIISKAQAEEIKAKLIAENPEAFGNAMTVYDGRRHLYSWEPLPEGFFTVKLARDDSEEREYRVVISLANKLDGTGLEDFLNRKIRYHWSVPQLLQAMNLVVREHPKSSRIMIGRSLYANVPELRDFIKHTGAVTARGFFMSLRPTQLGLSLNVDFSVVAFHQRVPVLDYLRERCRIDFKPSKALSAKCREAIETALKGLKVFVTHRQTKPVFTVMGLTKTITRDLKFQIYVNKEIGIMDYYQQRYKLDILFKKLPCLDFSRKSGKPNFVPMELCGICEGQRFPRDIFNAHQSKQFLDNACPSPRERCRRINEIMAKPDGPAGGVFLRDSNMSVESEMTHVRGRVIQSPELSVRDRGGKISNFTPLESGDWNFSNSHVYDGKRIAKWGVMYFAKNPDDQQTRKGVEEFCTALVHKCRHMGIQMEEKRMVFAPTRMAILGNAQLLRNTLTDIHTETRGELQILLCVMEEKHCGYKNLKLVCDTEIRLVTQCCLLQHVITCAFNKPHASRYLANLALEMNAKVGGSNVALARALPDEIPRFHNSHVVYFGADVNHPGIRDETSPSIASVVMSINWPDCNRYVFTLRCQPNREEYISKLGNMCKALLHEYLRRNKKLPERIIFFRDGVSEGQFSNVLNYELMDLKNAFGLLGQNYNPTVSFVVAQKRHHTRLFPLDGQNQVSGNVQPGTVVDSVIVHPWEFDFYLCSHFGSRGTSKPTHYHVLRDENNFTSDELQTLVNNVCYTYAKCTKPVSLVTPVYYADLAAFRGRMYVEAITGTSSTPSSCSSTLAFPEGVQDFMSFL